MKVLKWIVIAAVVIGAILFGIGSYQFNQAKTFIEGYGGKDVRILGSDDRIMCSHGVGLVVAYTIDGEDKLAPVCTDLFYVTELGIIK
jgi:hypothetical protein